MTIKEFDAKLNEDAKANRFKVQGAYIIFDNKSNLEYKPVPNFKLKELLTGNPANSYTRLNKAVILKLQRIRETIDMPVTVNSTYRDYYYNKANKGAKNSEHLKGNAIDATCKNVELLHKVALNEMEENGGGVGLYDTFVHIDTGEKRVWDSQKKSFDEIEDGYLLLSDDKKKNYALYGVIAFILIMMFK